MKRLVLAQLMLLLLCPWALLADIIQVDFEGVVDGTPITTQYPGLVFSNATAISAGASLNEFEFPPHSGFSVVFDDGGPISIAFTTPVLNFSGFFNYGTALTLTAFDASNTPVDSASSAFPENFVSSGNPTNELISLTFAGGISQVILAGDPGGGSFTLDDVTVTRPDSTAVPEVSSISLMVTTVGLLFLLIRPMRQRADIARAGLPQGGTCDRV